MLRNFFLGKRIKSLNHDIDPDEIFVDSQSSNVAFDDSQMEGKIEKAITFSSLAGVGFCFFIIIFIFAAKSWTLQVAEGNTFAEISSNNRLQHSVIFADRGTIYDRNGEPLSWSIADDNHVDFNERAFTGREGLAHTLGYIKYPKKDTSGVYYEEEFIGFGGSELYFDDVIKGENGLQIVETDALFTVVSSSTIQKAEHGEPLALTIDAEVQEALHNAIANIAEQVEFKGGAGVMMDVETGEIIAMTSYPEYNPQILTAGTNTEAISALFQDERNQLLNRVTEGLYTPGSIMKPFVALAALQEGVVNKNTEIYSAGKMLYPNRYNPDNPTVFSDWKAHGSVNVVDALAVSSNIYFYQVGGGFENQQGVGIAKLEPYFRKFGFGEKFNDPFFDKKSGTIPNPEWKKENFDGDDWRIGDTYFTAIGQYGFQVTPLQVVRGIAGIANGEKLLQPTIDSNMTATTSDDAVKSSFTNIEGIDEVHFQTVREGMREAVLRGTARAINVPYVEVAAKTGTAELGAAKANVNSWITGFFPYENPKYAFAVVMEKGKRTNLIGGSAVMRQFLDWMNLNKPEYFE